MYSGLKPNHRLYRVRPAIATTGSHSSRYARFVGASMSVRRSACPSCPHTQMYQAVSAQAAAIHEMFVNTLGTSAGSYAATEAANAIAVG
jgi:PE family